MILKKSDWKVRLYLWSLSYRADFHDEYYPEPDRTNLCEFVRACVLWLPLTLAIQIAALVLPFVAMVVYPIHLFGSDFWKVPLLCLGIPAVLLGLFLFVDWLKNKLFPKKPDSEYFHYESYYEHMEKKRQKFEASLIGMIVMWCKAKKQKICPMITLEDK